MNPSNETYIPWPLPYRVVTSGTSPDPDIRGLLAEIRNRTEEDDPLGPGMEIVFWNRMLGAIRLLSITSGAAIRVLSYRIALPWTIATGDIEESTTTSVSTSELRSEEFDAEVRALLDMGREVIFEDGMDNEFSRALATAVKRYGGRIIEVLFGLIVVNEEIDGRVAGEALGTLGAMEHPSTHIDRRWLLEQGLRCSSRYVRDGAALGLSSLNDHHAIPYLRQAVDREQLKELRKDLSKVLVELENCGQWRLF